MNKKATIALILSLTLLSSPGSAFAASGGRISSGGFSSSRSSSSPSRSYSPPSRSYSPPRTPSYSPPARRPSYDETPRRRSSYYDNDEDFLSLPPMRAPRIYVPAPAPVIVAPVTPVTPVEPMAPSAPAPPVVPAKPSDSSQNVQEQEDVSPILTFLFLLAFAAFVFMILKGSSGLVNTGYSSPHNSPIPPTRKRFHVCRLRVALLGSAKDLQSDLLNLTEKADTETQEGLAEVLKETTLSILRHPEKIVYADSLYQSGSEEEIGKAFDTISFEERSKLDEEIVSSVSGKVKEDKAKIGKGSSDDNEYILVSMIAATDQPLNIPQVRDSDSLRRGLISLGSASPESICGLEILWQPEGEGEVLSKEDLLSLYPTLEAI